MYISLPLLETLYVIACAQAKISSTLKRLRQFDAPSKVTAVIEYNKIDLEKFCEETLTLDRVQTPERTIDYVVADLSTFLARAVSSIEGRFKDILREEISVCKMQMCLTSNAGRKVIMRWRNMIKLKH